MTSITARDFMSTDLVTLAPDADVLDAVQLLLDRHVSGVPVVGKENRYLGVFSEKCSMQVLLDAAYEQLPVRDVRSYMDSEAQTIGPRTHLLSVAQVFLLTPYRLLPVVEKGRLIGQVGRREVLKCWLDLVADAPDQDRDAALAFFSQLFASEEAPLA